MRETCTKQIPWDQLPIDATHVLEFVPDFVGVADRDGKLLYINRAGKRMIGLAQDVDLSNYWIHDFFPNWTIATLAPSGTGNSSGADKCVDWNPHGTLRTLDGRDIPASQAVVAHTNGSSEISCFTIIARGAFFPTDTETAVQRIDIVAVVAESVSLARAGLPESVTIKELFESDNAAVLTDPAQIHQMVMNLCLNSAQSMGESGGEILISTSKVAIKGPIDPGGNALRAGNYVRLTIRDNGPGLAPSVATHVFEPAVVESNSAEGSIYTGLWNVKRTVVDTGGDIFVETAPDRGTAFHVYLPILGTNGNGLVA